MPLTPDMSLDDIIVAKKREAKKAFAKKFQTNPPGIRRQGGGKINKPVYHNKKHYQRPASPKFNYKTVRLNVTNLADTVISSDLLELFNEFSLISASVNFDENGDSRGTGELALSKFEADRLIDKFTGISLDGKAMSFALIEEPTGQANVFPVRKHNHESFLTVKSIKNYRFNDTKKPVKKDLRPKMTYEELDAELEDYMNGRN